MKATNFQYSRTVRYDNKNHLSVIIQRYGSINAKVLPVCLWNLVVAALLVLLNDLYAIDWTISEFGHEFMGMLVAFLIVSRASITFSLYYEFRTHVEALFQNTRALGQLSLSSPDIGRSDSLKIVLGAMQLLESTTKMVVGNDARGNSSDFMLRKSGNVMPSSSNGDGTTWSHHSDRESDLNMSMTVRRTFLLRQLIGKSSNESSLSTYHLHETVDRYENAYYGIRKYLTTPFPFPLVQMARFVLFLYVLTLPFALLSTDTSLIQAFLLVFIVSYGYLGIEQVSIELDDPFGDDPSDFPILDMAESVYDDIGWMVQTEMGPAAVSDLQEKFGKDRMTTNMTDTPRRTGTRPQSYETTPLL